MVLIVQFGRKYSLDLLWVSSEKKKKCNFVTKSSDMPQLHLVSFLIYRNFPEVVQWSKISIPQMKVKSTEDTSLKL